MMKTAWAYFMSGMLPAVLWAGLIHQPGGGLENVALFFGWFLGILSLLATLPKVELSEARTHLVWRQVRAVAVCVIPAWSGHFALAAILLIGCVMVTHAIERTAKAKRAEA